MAQQVQEMPEGGEGAPMVKVGLHEKAGDYFVVPGTVVVDNNEPIRFWNSTSIDARVYSAVPGSWAGSAQAGLVQANSKRVFTIASAPDGVYEFAVLMGSKLAQGNSAPRIIIDG